MKLNKKMMRTVALCSCFGLAILGIGFFTSSKPEPQQNPTIFEQATTDLEKNMTVIEVAPVTMSQTQTVAETLEQQMESIPIESAILPEDTWLSEEPTETASIEPITEEASLSEPATPVFSYPVYGEILLPYSVESAIYDPTLDQYRTNAVISLKSKEGTEVLCAEQGIVKEIFKDEERGNSITIEHSEGWLTTYSQLAENMLVAVGDTVEKGQPIGTVAQPTKYTVALGEHMEFSMQKDGVLYNPEEILSSQ